MADRKAYPSDLTDAEWEILEPLIPEVSENATIPTIARREIVNGILYMRFYSGLLEASLEVHTQMEAFPLTTIPTGIESMLRSGCPWRLLPNDLPAWGTVYYYLRTWRIAGIWDKALEALRKQMHRALGRDEGPSAAVIDSQSIKTSAVRGESKGFDMGKSANRFAEISA